MKRIISYQPSKNKLNQLKGLGFPEALFNGGVDITKISFRGDIHKTLSTVFDDEFLCETIYFVPDNPSAKYPEYTHLKINLYTIFSL